jgi:sugar transferase (PEP-CTERM/EpsH1 system associated)
VRILFVTPYVPSRIRVRPFNLIKSLSVLHDISLVPLVCDEYEQEMLQDIANYCISVDPVYLPRWLAYANCLRALPTRTPLRVAYYKSSTFVRRIQQVIRERAIDVVHGELIKVVPALQAVLAQEDIPVLFDAVDCISAYLQQQWNLARNPLEKAFIYEELKKMHRYEPRVLSALNRVVITSAYDRDYLIALGEQPHHIQVVQNGVDTEYFTPPTSPREKDSLVFCAKLDYYPNSQAIVDFCQNVLPLIWKRRPQVRLTIVGNGPPASVHALSVDNRISVIGYVPDTRPYLGRASVALAPLKVAVGIQNKVLEALAMGTPLVATPASCRALQVSDGEHLLMAEENHAYAEAILKLLEEPLLAQNLGIAGRQYMKEHHGWMEAANTLSDLYHDLLSGQRHRERVLDVVRRF